MDERFDLPLYTIGEVSRHLAINAETLRRWTQKDELINKIPARRNNPSLPFIALAEAQFYRALRAEGLSLQAISVGMRAVREQFGQTVLQRGLLAHDGKDLLLNLANSGDAPEWTRARDGQGGLPGVIERGLKEITFGKDQLPARVRLPIYGGADVIVDPRLAFGQPVVNHAGVRIEDVVSLFNAGEPIATVAEEFGIESRIVESILRVQSRQAA